MRGKFAMGTLLLSWGQEANAGSLEGAISMREGAMGMLGREPYPRQREQHVQKS